MRKRATQVCGIRLLKRAESGESGVRDADDGRRELDLVLEVGHNKVIGIEIKSTASPTNDDARHLRWFRERFGESVLATVLFHTGPDSFWLAHDVLAAPIASLWQ